MSTDGQVEVEGEELGELKGLETVDDEGFVEGSASEDLSMKDEAVSAGAGEVASDGCVGNMKDSSDLTQTWTFGGELGYAVEQVPAFEPVIGSEGAGGESSLTVGATEALERSTVGGSTEDAIHGGIPVGGGEVVTTVDVWAMRRAEGAAAGVDGWTEFAHDG